MLGPTAPAVLASNAVLGPAAGFLSQDLLEMLTRAGPGMPGHKTLPQEGRKAVPGGQPNALGSSQPAGNLLVPPGACPSWCDGHGAGSIPGVPFSAAAKPRGPP